MKIAQEEMSGQENLNSKHRNQMRPIFEMLKHKKSELNSLDWENLVKVTEKSILNSPHQYLSGLQNEHLANLLIHRLFDEFRKELIQAG